MASPATLMSCLLHALNSRKKYSDWISVSPPPRPPGLMPPSTSQDRWFIFNTKDQTHLACPLTTWVFILYFKYYKHVPTPGPLHMPCGFCLPRFHRAASWLLRVQFTVPLLLWALPLCPHFHACSRHPVPLLHTHPSPVSIRVCLGNDNGSLSLMCFQGLEEYSHPLILFMGDWFWDPLRYQISDI